MQRQLSRSLFFLSKNRQDCAGYFSNEIIPPEKFFNLNLNQLPDDPFKFNNLLFKHRQQGLVIHYDHKNPKERIRAEQLKTHTHCRGHIPDKIDTNVIEFPLNSAFDNTQDWTYSTDYWVRDLEHTAPFDFIDQNKNRGHVELLPVGAGDLEVVNASRVASEADKFWFSELEDIFKNNNVAALQQIHVSDMLGTLYDVMRLGYAMEGFPETNKLYENYTGGTLRSTLKLPSEGSQCRRSFKVEAPRFVLARLLELGIGNWCIDRNSPEGFYVPALKNPTADKFVANALASKEETRMVKEILSNVAMRARFSGIDRMQLGSDYVSARLLLTDPKALVVSETMRLQSPEVAGYVDAIRRLSD